jgi:hypothetical protein
VKPPETMPPPRPRLLPAGAVARLALVAILAFTLFRGLLFGATTPAFWGPDEDYHFLYMNYLVTQHALPSAKHPLYSREYSELADATRYNDYGTGPRGVFQGDPKASLHRLSRLPKSAREPTAIGRGVGVVHPPLYQLAGAAVDALAGDAPMQTRVAWVRVMSALFGVLATYTAWLLAAQVSRRVAPQLLVAGLVALQPMIGFLSGIVNHDIALIAFSNAALAFMLFALKTPPRPRQGLWLGLATALALMVKGSALALLPLAALAFAAQGLAHRERWREAAKAALIAFGLIAVIAGWWYVRARIVYGSVTGAVVGGGGGGAQPAHADPTIGQLVTWAKEWTGLTYRTYWWHYQYFEAQRGSSWYFVPALVGVVGIAGLARVAWQERGRLLDPKRPLLRQIVLMTGAVLAPYLSFLAVDLQRRSTGAGFYVNGGRYLLPAFAAAATLLVIGIDRLVRGWGRVAAYGLVVLLATIFAERVYVINYAQRYFGQEPIGELLRRLSFDRPDFVTPFTLWIVIAGTVFSAVAFGLLLLRSAISEAKAPVP